ncbi:MAG: 2-amino-4-hydroxy-6-hydroxymethyldihydropteridine diphosphokinase [Longimonas sp.]|uniref:2-amino-4-hydroxy-6- hydroxymethyldihydropteridine diphosphokinase n=1 Tax=Longimonas sp. TaxID=2039626 RepID=UPI00335C6D17
MPASVSSWTSAYLGLGANTGRRYEQVGRALAQLDAQDDISVRRVSSPYETEAHRLPGQDPVPSFLNAVAHIRTTLSPEALLHRTQALESDAGRVQAARWAPRPLDIDLLVVGASTRATEQLTLPHPRLAQRRFVLAPWAELAPNLWVPDPFDATVENLYRACADPHAIRRVDRSLSTYLSLPETPPSRL